MFKFYTLYLIPGYENELMQALEQVLSDDSFKVNAPRKRNYKMFNLIWVDFT